jgi:hypothetical protein
VARVHKFAARAIGDEALYRLPHPRAGIALAQKGRSAADRVEERAADAVFRLVAEKALAVEHPVMHAVETDGFIGRITDQHPDLGSPCGDGRRIVGDFADARRAAAAAIVG